MTAIPVRRLMSALLLIAFALVGLAFVAPEALAASALQPYKLDRFLSMGQPGMLSAWYALLIFAAGSLAWTVLAQRAPSRAGRRFYWLMVVLSVFFTVDHSTNTLKVILRLWTQWINKRSTSGLAEVFLAGIMLILYLGRTVTASWRLARQTEYYAGCILVTVGWLWRLSDPDLLARSSQAAALATLFSLLGGVLLLHCALEALAQGMPITLTFERRRALISWLVRIVAVFLLLSAVWRVLQVQPGSYHFNPYRLWELFDVRDENNLPTVFSALLLTGSAVLLGLIALAHRGRGRIKWRPWIGLAAIFTYLSLDESASLHEKLVGPIHRLMPALARESHGLLAYGWVVPFGVLLVIFLLVSIPFLRSLPPKTRFGMMVSGLVYVTGALVFELLEGYAERNWPNDVRPWLETAEEGLEMLGVILFIDTLLRYLAEHVRSVTLKLRVTDPASPD